MYQFSWSEARVHQLQDVVGQRNIELAALYKLERKNAQEIHVLNTAQAAHDTAPYLGGGPASMQPLQQQAREVKPPIGGALPSRRHCHEARSKRIGSRQAKRWHSNQQPGLGKNSPCLKKTSRDLSGSSWGNPEDRVTEVRWNLTFPRTSRCRLVRHGDPDRVAPRSRRSTCHCILQDHTKVWALPPRLVRQIKDPIMVGACSQGMA